MSSSSLRGLIRSPSRHARPCPQRARRFRPRLEALEDRLVPAAVYWTNPDGGDWAAPENWSTGALPGQDDDVVIDLPDITVTHSTGTDLVRSITSDAAFALSGGSLSFYDRAVMNNTFDLSGGSLPHQGVLTVNGLFTWTGGRMTGLSGTGGLPISRGSAVANGGMVLAGGAKALSLYDLTNAGTATWTGGNITLDRSTLINRAGAAFDVQTDSSISDLSDLAVISGPGAFRKSAGTGVTTIDVRFGGALEVQSGTARLTRSTGGDFTVGEGARLEFLTSVPIGGGPVFNLRNVTGAGDVYFNAAFGVTISGAYNVTGSTEVDRFARVRFAGPVTNVGSSLIVRGMATFDGGSAFAIDTLALSGTLAGNSSVTVTGTFDWTGGTMTGTGSTDVDVTGTLNLSGSADKVLDGRTLNLYGTTVWADGGNLSLLNSPAVVNQAGGVFTIQNDRGLLGVGTFLNAGTLTKGGGAGTTSVAAGVSFVNDGGAVDVQSGTLNVGGAYVQNGGTTRVGAGATLTAPVTYLLDGAVLDLAAGATLTSAGGVTVLGGTLAGSGRVNGNVVNSGSVVVGGAGGTGVLTINGHYTQTATGDLQVEIGGPGAGTGFDQLVVTGQARLDGTLTVTLVNDFAPAAGDSFQVLTFGSSSVFPALDDGGLFDAVYNPRDLTLVAR